MKPLLNCFSALLTLLTVSGCAVVTTPAPVGNIPLEIAPDEWDGAWTGGDRVMEINVVDALNGIFQVTWIDDEGDQPVAKILKAHLRSAEDWTFVSFEDPERDEGDPVRFYWGRVEKKNGTAIVWVPRAAKFKEVVEAGKIPGTVDKGNVHLGKLSRKHLELIMSEAEGVLFVWDDPQIYRRISHD